MNESGPLVSVGVPTFNRAGQLRRAVESIQRQDVSGLEILISDNASTDGTERICRDLVRSDGRIRYFRQPANLGPFPNFEFVLKSASGRYFMWVSDDDLLESGILSRYVEFLEAHPGYILVSGTIRYWDRGSVVLEEKGFTFNQEDPVERIRAFYTEVERGGIFHGLMRREEAVGIEVKNLLGSDWYFISTLLRRGKIMQLDFPAYRKDFGGFSDGFENYARVIGASRFARYNPILAIAWHVSCDLWVNEILPGLSWRRRLGFAVQTFSLILRRFYLDLLFSNPPAFFRMVLRSVVKTACPERWLRLFWRGEGGVSASRFGRLSEKGPAARRAPPPNRHRPNGRPVPPPS